MNLSHLHQNSEWKENDGVKVQVRSYKPDPQLFLLDNLFMVLHVSRRRQVTVSTIQKQ